MKALTFLKIFTVVNVLVATGFAVAGIVNPHLLLAANVTTDKAIIVFALYAGARGIPMATLTIMSVFSKHWNAFITLAVLAGAIQFLDGFIGIYQQDLSKAAGPFIIATIQFIAIYLAVRNNDKFNNQINKENIA
jgi:ethanolamine transporter EutH